MATDADDIFASLGGSLMRDILGTNSTTTSEDILSSLEAELDASMPPPPLSNNDVNNTFQNDPHHPPSSTNPASTNSLSQGFGNLHHVGMSTPTHPPPPPPPPPPHSSSLGISLPPPGLTVSNQNPTPSSRLHSGAALIVSHQQQQQQFKHDFGISKNVPSLLPHGVMSMSSPSSSALNINPNSFAFDPNAVDDFLRNDAARKKEKDIFLEEEMRKAMDRVLFEDDEEIEESDDKNRDDKAENETIITGSKGVVSGMGSRVESGKSGTVPPPGLGMDLKKMETVAKSVPVSSSNPPNTLPTTNSNKTHTSNSIVTNPVALLPPFLQSKVASKPFSPPPTATPQTQPSKMTQLPTQPPQVQGQPVLPPHLLPPPQPPLSLQQGPPGLPPQLLHPTGQPPPPPGPPLPNGLPIQPPPPPPPPPPTMPPDMNANPAGVPPNLQPPFLLPTLLPNQLPPNQVPLRQPPQIPNRFYFHHPHPKTPPVQATKFASSLMTGRDLSYVIHSILRPLHVLHADAKQEDYYYLEREQRKLAFYMPNNNRNGEEVGGSLYNPSESVGVSKNNKTNSRLSGSSSTQQKQKQTQTQKKQQSSSSGRQDEALFREKVEHRAKEWKSQTQVLGHVVKSNIHRPRALLDLSLLSNTSSEEGSSDDNNDNDKGLENAKDGKELENVSEEDQATVRAMLWKARKLMDVGYSYFLAKDNVRLTRLILERGRDSNETLTVESNEEEFVNLGTLLMLPKGRDLLARCLEYKRAPMGHPTNYTPLAVFTKSMDSGSSTSNAEQTPNVPIISSSELLDILPSIFTNLFVHPAGLKKGEDRLLYVIISYIIAIVDDFTQESPTVIHVGNQFISALKSVVTVSKSQQQNSNMKKMLGSRARAEVMHALITKGMEICEHSTVLGKEWKDIEEEFINLLSNSSDK